MSSVKLNSLLLCRTVKNISPTTAARPRREVYRLLCGNPAKNNRRELSLVLCGRYPSGLVRTLVNQTQRSLIKFTGTTLYTYRKTAIQSFDFTTKLVKLDDISRKTRVLVDFPLVWKSLIFQSNRNERAYTRSLIYEVRQ